MLKRIQKIKNIGRFADCSPAGCEFAFETIIFGYNTQGKSTLTSILRSVQTGNNKILIGRKTFGAAGGKYVEIDLEETLGNDKYVFQNRSWNKTNENIVIFDSKFIAENVFNGEKIVFDQQRNLNTVIIGKRGQELNKEILNLQEKSQDFATKKTDMTAEFSRHFPGFDFDKFKALPKDNQIVQKILDKEREIKFENEKEEIKSIIKSHTQKLRGIKFSIRDSLVKTLNLKQGEIEKHIKSHLSTEENATSFLKEGLEFLKDKPTSGSKRHCVFCGQELGEEAESLIEILHSFFKAGYEELQKEMNEAIDYFNAINLEALLTKMADDLNAKNIDIALDETRVDMLIDLKRQFEKELYKKRDLNYSINFKTFEQLKNGVEQVEKDLEELEKNKLNISPAKSISDLMKELKELEVINMRHEQVWEQFCNDWDTLEKEAKQIRAERDKKRKELEAYSTKVFDTHKESINDFCKQMCADFVIEDFKPLKKLFGKEERIFAIRFFNSHKVSIDNEDDDKPNFQNTLSESDKRLLAFAFLLSLLLHDRELDKKIIVFDDPMSSFDSERRRRTVHLITDICCKYKETHGEEKTILPRQKIILTHEERFAKELVRLMINPRTLKIEEYVDGDQKRSKIVHANYDQDFPDDDISNRILKIKEIIDSRNFNASFEDDCRIVLEHIFKRKYCLELKNEIDNKKSVRTFVERLYQERVNGFDSKTKHKNFTRLCDDLNIELHDGNPSNSPGDKESILRDFFECLRIV